jgi:hypothetical protein
MIIIEVSQGIIATPMYIINTPNVLPLATIGWIMVTITIILCQALWAPKSPTDEKPRDNLCMSIPRGMFITPINEEFLPCPNAY